nr:leucyl aminopeptidase family protein [Pseudovibrio flavus]
MTSLVPFDAALKPVPVYAVTTQTFAETAEGLGPKAAGWAKLSGFKGTSDSVLVVPSADGSVELVLAGLGDSEGTAMQAGAALSRGAPEGVYALVNGCEDEAGFALGFALASYRFDRYAKAKPANAKLMLSEAVALADLSPVIGGAQLARDLINTPANDMGPAELAQAAQALFDMFEGSVSITLGEDLEREFPLVHAVGKGSARAPRLIDARWGDENAPKVTLVGKGVVFDTGGLDIKPASGMLLMKKDMGGAANVLGLAAMIMEAQLPIRLRVIVPAVENAVSGTSFRPSDVFTSRKGLSVEIGNTDAEGRLVLADALALADEEAPEMLLDLATLTGAARVALGPDLPPFYTDDEELAENIAIHAEAVFDPLWRLPLWKPYRKYITSKIADIANVNTSGAGFAGSMTAALFLQSFVENAQSWAHFDIYGWTPIEKDIRVQGGECQAARALFDLLKTKYG